MGDDPVGLEANSLEERSVGNTGRGEENVVAGVLHVVVLRGATGREHDERAAEQRRNDSADAHADSLAILGDPYRFFEYGRGCAVGHPPDVINLLPNIAGAVSSADPGSNVAYGCVAGHATASSRYASAGGHRGRPLARQRCAASPVGSADRSPDTGRPWWTTTR